MLAASFAHAYAAAATKRCTVEFSTLVGAPMLGLSIWLAIGWGIFRAAAWLAGGAQ